jgi:hypothetical protein
MPSSSISCRPAMVFRRLFRGAAQPDAAARAPAAARWSWRASRVCVGTTTAGRRPSRLRPLCCCWLLSCPAAACAASTARRLEPLVNTLHCVLAVRGVCRRLQPAAVSCCFQTRLLLCVGWTVYHQHMAWPHAHTSRRHSVRVTVTLGRHTLLALWRTHHRATTTITTPPDTPNNCTLWQQMAARPTPATRACPPGSCAQTRRARDHAQAARRSSAAPPPGACATHSRARSRQGGRCTPPPCA